MHAVKHYFENSQAHLLAELERIDLLVRAQVCRMRKGVADDEQFRGLYLSEQDVDALLDQPLGRPHWFPARDEESAGIASRIDSLARVIRLRRNASLKLGIELRLDRLRRMFELDRFELDALLICVAVELDLRYERLYAYLQDDVTRKKPSVDLVLNLLTNAFEDKLAKRQNFTPTARLIRHNLLALSVDPSRPDPPLLGQYLKVDARILEFLLGRDELDPRIRFSATAVDLHSCSHDCPSAHSTAATLCRFIRSTRSEERLLLELRGPKGIGKLGIAGTVCHELGTPLIAVDLEQFTSSEGEGWDRLLYDICREARLRGAALYWKAMEVLPGEAATALRNAFLRALEYRPPLTFLAGESSGESLEALRDLVHVRVELPRPAAEERARIWARELEGQAVAFEEPEPKVLATKFRFTQGQIRHAAKTAINLSGWRDPESPVVTIQDLYEACRFHSSHRLSTLARKITPKYRWGDLVLPSDRMEQLREICNYVKYRSRVYDDWGFDRKLAMGKGLSALFAGPSGTGKTMAADIIAGELGLDLYKIDLATVVSKYIGDTEKNLSRIFSEAETSNSILFFDEADALFGKRSEVQDSHDRYANIETAYLLQRMEEYEGVVILATNFRKNMDEAFVRRLHFSVDFPFPDEEDRRRIWEGVWPEAVPRDSGLDVLFLAKRFQITGGNIRNIALSAAFMAADDGGEVAMRHLLRAIQREFQKMGKVVTETDFGFNNVKQISGMV